MTCYLCGGHFEKVVTSPPFQVGTDSIVILKNTPVLQCHNCSEYLIEDAVWGSTLNGLFAGRAVRVWTGPPVIEYSKAGIPLPQGDKL